MPEIDGHAVPAPTPPVYKPQDDGGWLGDVVGSVAEAASEAANSYGAAVRNPGGPGFAFDHDQLMSIARRWDRLAERFRADQEIAERFGNARPPGSEYASKNNVDQIVDSGRLMGDAFSERAKYCDSQAEKFRRAAGEYQKADDDAKNRVSGDYTGSL